MKTRYFISAALLALTTVGCSDLDVDIKSQYTEYPDSEIALSARITMLITPSAVLWDAVMTNSYLATPTNIPQSVSMEIT